MDWNPHFGAAFAVGLFDGKLGEELRGRLTGVDDDNFRSGLSECLAAWFLVGPMGFKVKPRPEGRTGKVPDLLAETQEGDLHVEVKSPYRPTPRRGWCGNDADLLANALREANQQFAEDGNNVLFIVPSLRTTVYTGRYQLTSAFFGELNITCPIDLKTGGAAGPAKMKFFPEGRFLNPCDKKGRRIKPDGMPPFTRVGTVVTVEETSERHDSLDGCSYPGSVPLVSYRMLVVHNPYARRGTTPGLWGECPQFFEKDGRIGWSDGRDWFP